MNPARDMPCPPAEADIPAPKRRNRRGAAVYEPFSVEIETTTPILGGAPKTRSIDDVDVIRVPTIRGHLRFWWRALQTGCHGSATALYREEARLWGTAADESGGARSPVALSVKMKRSGTVDPKTMASAGGGAYALWPARKPRQGPGEAAPSRSSGVAFTLSVTVSSDAADLKSVREAIRAWIMFGGYGSRTRRGVGSMKVTGPDRHLWLPDDDEGDMKGETLRGALRSLFATGPSASSQGPEDYPRLAGATLFVGPLEPNNAETAWHAALRWLRQFRQDDHGRDPRPGARSPGRSYWLEPDKLRLLAPSPIPGHPPRYLDPTPAWPRADFGLPIVGQFQGGGEPDPFTLTWQVDGKQRERMASPVIVKALPTLGGYRPCVLWLNRNHPPGDVVAIKTSGKRLIPGSNAPFGFLGAPADRALEKGLKSPLAGHASVKDAFFAWVKSQGAVQVAP